MHIKNRRKKNTLPEYYMHAHTVNKVLFITFFCRRRQKDKNPMISTFIQCINHANQMPPPPAMVIYIYNILIIMIIIIGIYTNIK